MALTCQPNQLAQNTKGAPQKECRQMEFTKIYEDQANERKSFELINRGYGPDQRFAGQWFETDYDTYQYFLGVLPPMDFQADAFSMCEFATGSLTDCFVQQQDRFFCICLHREKPADFTNTVTAFREHIRVEA